MPNPVVDFPFDWGHATQSVLIHAGPCVLHTVNIGSLGAGITVSLLDGNDAAGTPISIISGSATFQPCCLTYDVRMATGLYCLFAGGVGDVSISYK